MKIPKLFRDFSRCPEEDLHIFCLLSEAALACFQLSRLPMGLGKGLAGSHLFSAAECVSVGPRTEFSLSEKRGRKGGAGGMK